MNFYKMVKPYKSKSEVDTPYGMKLATHILQLGNAKVFLPKNHNTFLNFLNNEAILNKVTPRNLNTLAEQFSRSRVMASTIKRSDLVKIKKVLIAQGQLKLSDVLEKY